MPLPNVMLLGSNPFIIPTNNHPALYDIMGRNVVFWPSFWLKNGLRSNCIPIPSKWALSWNVGNLFPELKLVTFHFQEPTNILVLILPFLHDCSIPRCTCLAHLKLFFSCSYLSWDSDKIQPKWLLVVLLSHLVLVMEEKTNCQWLSAICLWLFLSVFILHDYWCKK